MWIAPSLRIGMAVLIALAMGMSLGPEPTRLRHSAEPFPALVATPHVFELRTKSDAALADWALGRFQQAGLELPPLIIAFHDDKQPCRGHVGLYRSGDTPRVDICGFNWDRFLITPKKTLLHELGHAWAGATLTDEMREEFVQFRELNTWGNDRFPWAEQGSEQAAEIIAWALLDEDLVIASIGNNDPQTLIEAYELLTSTLPPSRSSGPSKDLAGGDRGIVAIDQLVGCPISNRTNLPVLTAFGSPEITR